MFNGALNGVMRTYTGWHDRTPVRNLSPKDLRADMFRQVALSTDLPKVGVPAVPSQ